MPQPIHYSYLISFDFGPEAILDRPQLAAHVAGISALWNEIEARTAAFLAALLGGEAKTGISMFFAITNDGAKRAVIDAVCSLKLKPDQNKELQAIMKKIGERYGERNRAIHGAWGISDLYPDALLWSDTRETIQLQVDVATIFKNAEAAKQLRLEFQKRIQVWKESDFKDVERRIKSQYDELYWFTKPFIDDSLEKVGLKSARREDLPLPYSRAHPAPNDDKNGQR